MLRELRPGECFGELVLLGLTTLRTATVRAKEACDIRVLLRPRFLLHLHRCAAGRAGKPGSEGHKKE